MWPQVGPLRVVMVGVGVVVVVVVEKWDRLSQDDDIRVELAPDGRRG